MPKGKAIKKLRPGEITWERIHMDSKTYLVTSDSQRTNYFLYEIQEDGQLIRLNQGATPVQARESILTDSKCKRISK